jgi:Mrp family chromosome partitioning ATPase
MLQHFTPVHPQVVGINSQIRQVLAERRQLEALHPSLTNVNVRLDRESDKQGTELDLAVRVRSLRAKRDKLESQLELVREEALKLENREAEIVQAELKRTLNQKQYELLSSSVEQARVDAAFDPGRLANISIIEEPTPAGPDYIKLLKMVAIALIGGVGAGLGLACFLEFFADQTVHRPIHVEKNLQSPLFLTIPKLRLKPGSDSPSAGGLLPASAGNGENGSNTMEVGPAEDDLKLYSEALRDRLIMHFQLTGAVHKPKLVGVTSCGHGAGVTTVALSLAAALSETGDGNVLYVNVDTQRGPSAHQFRAGKSMIGIADALESERREAAMVQENLAVATLSDSTGQRVGVLPKRLSSLLPRLKASDYDYIIFDRPPITQTSATGRLGGLLDITLVTLDSGKTHKELARRATELLAKSRAQVGVILNNHRRFLPGRFKTDL